LIHYDTPWHAALVEQRIGRLDRLGRERSDVTSHVLFCNGTEEEGLIRCLETGLEVYGRSISGLEFGLRELEQKMTSVAISEGRDGLLGMATELKTAASIQRAEDESAELLDEASYERLAAADFRRVQSGRSGEQALEHAFAQYFKAIAGPKAVYFKRDPEFPEGIVSFQPEDVRDTPLQLVRNDAGRLVERCGTFYRKIAQERPDLEFFSIGNEFFDAVCNSLFAVTSMRQVRIAHGGT
jgi:ATP-dependent helicase HepA